MDLVPVSLIGQSDIYQVTIGLVSLSDIRLYRADLYIIDLTPSDLVGLSNVIVFYMDLAGVNLVIMVLVNLSNVDLISWALLLRELF